MVKTIKKLLPKSVIGWIFFIIAGSWIAYFFMNAHSIFDKLNKSVPSWIGMVIFFGILLWSMGAEANDDNDMFNNNYDDDDNDNEKYSNPYYYNASTDLSDIIIYGFED